MDAALTALLDRNLLDASREFARWQVGAVLTECDGVLTIAGATDFPVGYANSVLRADRSTSPADVLERARAFFEPRRRGYTIFVRAGLDQDLEEALGRAGVKSFSDTPCMVVERPLGMPRLGDGVTLEHVTDLGGVAAAAAINAEAYESLGLPAAETRALYGRPACLLAPHLVTVVGRRDGVPVSTAMIIESPGVAGVYWVGTTTGGRRSGLAEACTRRVTDDAFARGARAVTLQASPMGEPIYARIGYRTFDRLRWYVCPPPR